jgi:hypothetical protein
MGVDKRWCAVLQQTSACSSVKWIAAFAREKDGKCKKTIRKYENWALVSNISNLNRCVLDREIRMTQFRHQVSKTLSSNTFTRNDGFRTGLVGGYSIASRLIHSSTTATLVNREFNSLTISVRGVERILLDTVRIFLSTAWHLWLTVAETSLSMFQTIINYFSDLAARKVGRLIAPGGSRNWRSNLQK